MAKKKESKKFYVYVDESGQDSKGEIFIVSVVILKGEREKIVKKLEEIEAKSGKGRIKWHKAHYKCNRQYMKKILKSDLFRKMIFFATSSNIKNYLKFMAETTSRSLLLKIKNSQNYRARIYIDAFNKKEIQRFQKEIKRFNIKRKKVRGIRNENSDVFIRLADAICGLARKAEKKERWAKDILEEMETRGIVTRI